MTLGPTRPDLEVYVGFGSNWRTEPGSITWTRITPYVMDRRQPVTMMRGSTAIHGEPDPGTFALTLRNHDRRFDPLHATGPHYGSLVPGVPVKLVAQPSGLSTANVWLGTIKSWPQRYDPGNRTATVPVSGYDGFDKTARAKIPQAVYPLEVLADSPSAYWRLDEAQGIVMLDDSGNSHRGVYDNAVLGEDPLIIDGDGASMLCEHVGDNRGQYVGGALPTAAPVTIEAWVKVERDLTQIHTILVVQRDTAYGSGLSLSIETSAGGSPNGELVVFFNGLGGFYKARGHTRIDDGETHHVVMTMASTAAVDIKLYVDSVLQTKTLISGTTGGTWTSHLMWVVGNVAASSLFDFGLGGHIDEVAVYPSALSAARVLAHYEAGTLALDGQTTDDRIDYVLDHLDWPTGLRDLEVGQSILGPATFHAGDSALEYLRLCATTEDGSLFLTAAGKWRLLDRYWRYTATAATVSQMTFADSGAGVGVAEFELEPADDELLVNVARFTRRGGSEQVAVDTTSRDLYGEAEIQRSDLLHRTDGETRGQAEWAVATRSQPEPYVRKILLRLHKMTPERQAQVLALDLGHRVTCTRRPQSTGTAFSLDFVVSGIKHMVTAAEWLVELYVSPAPDSTVELFTLGTSTLGGADILAY